MLRFVLQLLRSLAVLVTLLLQRWGERGGWAQPRELPGAASAHTSSNTSPTFADRKKTPCPRDAPAKSRVYCSLERSI